MPEWTGDGPDWVNFEEQLAPKVWIYVCKRPDGYDWSPHVRERLVYWAHVYVFDRPLSSRGRGFGRETIEHYPLHDVDPLMLSCLEYEMRNKYQVHNDRVG